MSRHTHDFSTISDSMHTNNNKLVSAEFRDYSITSAFQPIFSLSHRHPVGYEALCRAKSADGMPISPMTLFDQVSDESDNVFLDRLCRAIHVKNFSRFTSKSWIFLNVNPLVTILGKNYGSFFKEMLERNNIPPSQVVIEILEKKIYDESILAAAINYYKDLGCLIAIDDFGASHSNFDRIWNIKPDIVKFDRSIIVQAEQCPIVRKALPNMVALIQDIGCITLMEGIETEQQALIAIDSNVDLVQGYYFGYPAEHLVDPFNQDDTLSRLSGKHNEISTVAKSRYQELVDFPLTEFKAALQKISTGAQEPDMACPRLLALPNVNNMYFLDENGYQIGGNIINQLKPETTDLRFRPLFEAKGANWSRRHYFKQAIRNPGEIQTTRPYRSMLGKAQCITLSALINSPSGKLVACLDLNWAY